MASTLAKLLRSTVRNRNLTGEGMRSTFCSITKKADDEIAFETLDVRNRHAVIPHIRAASNHFGQEEIVYSLAADACIQVCPENPAKFNVDNVHVVKLLGGALENSCLVRGIVLRRSYALGSIKAKAKAKVAVYVDGSLVLIPPSAQTTAAETKGDVLKPTASDEQLENYAETEEAKVEKLIKAVAESGVKVIVSGGPVGEMALHFCERYKLMVLKTDSKLELERFCKTAGAVALLQLSRPSPNDLGFVDSISVEDIGGARVTVARTEKCGNSISTVVLRGATDSILDHTEAAVLDMAKKYDAMCRGNLPVAAATVLQRIEDSIQRVLQAVEKKPVKDVKWFFWEACPYLLYTLLYLVIDYGVEVYDLFFDNEKKQTAWHEKWMKEQAKKKQDKGHMREEEKRRREVEKKREEETEEEAEKEDNKMVIEVKKSRWGWKIFNCVGAVGAAVLVSLFLGKGG